MWLGRPRVWKRRGNAAEATVGAHPDLRGRPFAHARERQLIQFMGRHSGMAGRASSRHAFGIEHTARFSQPCSKLII